MGREMDNQVKSSFLPSLSILLVCAPLRCQTTLWRVKLCMIFSTGPHRVTWFDGHLNKDRLLSQQIQFKPRPGEQQHWMTLMTIWWVLRRHQIRRRSHTPRHGRRIRRGSDWMTGGEVSEEGEKNCSRDSIWNNWRLMVYWWIDKCVDTLMAMV